MKSFNHRWPILPSLFLLSLIISMMFSTAEAQFVQQGSKLLGIGSVGTAYQGYSTALSADGNTAIVGGDGDNVAAGAAWVYTRSAGVWTQQGSKLVGTGAVGSAYQGCSVSLSADGNTAIVGGYADNAQAGAAWVYTRSGGVWTQQGSKLVGTGAVGTANQGWSVSLSADGNTAIVGGVNDNISAGATWIYTRSAGVWTQQGTKLVGADAVGSAYQGQSVSLSTDGNTAIVGGGYDSFDAGAAWVYTRSGGVWTQQGDKLVGTGAVGDAYQGWSVFLSADGNTAVVGGYLDNSGLGAAWVYTRSAGVWTQQGSKLVGTGAVGIAYQGQSVSLSADGNTAIVGGSTDNSIIGAAWIHTRSGGVWTQQGNKLVGTGGVGQGRQGASVALSADGRTAIVGGYRDDSFIGAAWVYAVEIPVIGSISDIPNDQGGSLRITWDKFLFDTAGTSPQITSYGIWRKVRPGLSATAHKRSVPPQELSLLADSLSQYDYLLSVPAVQVPSYNVVVPSLEDSSAGGIPYFTYLVTGHTANVSIYFMSEPDSGYSVDNLAPIPPAGLTAAVQPGPQVELNWDPPLDQDVRSYSVYRSTTGGFTPGPGNTIGTSGSTSFTDASPVSGVASYYRIVAVDIHDNVSGPSGEVSAAVTVNQQFNVQDKWNIVSVPLAMGDYTKTVLFPTGTTNAFTFEDGYVAYGIVENGRGYWMKFSGGETISHTGMDRTEDTIVVSAGWNMVGSLSVSLPVSNIGSIPGGIVTSSFFAYDVGYSSSPKLEPGRGYWVKVSEAGQLVMTSTGAVSSNRIRITDTGELPPAPPDDVSSAVPNAYALGLNYPNPFNPVTSITYALPFGENVRLSVFNMLGQEVDVLVDEAQDAGFKTVSFDAGHLPSGVYTYRITAGTFSDAKRMLIIK